jgi:hypothetical protein
VDKITEAIIIEKGVRQCCEFLLLLFNTYTNKIAQEWKTMFGAIRLSVETRSCADDHILISKSEDELQFQHSS